MCKWHFKSLMNTNQCRFGTKFIRCTMIFDLKLEDFRCKALLVARGHMTATPATMTYVSVVSCESASIALRLADLKKLEVKYGDV